LIEWEKEEETFQTVNLKLFNNYWATSIFDITEHSFINHYKQFEDGFEGDWGREN